MQTNLVRNTQQHHDIIMDLWVKIKLHWTLIKSKQTFLLVITGWAGFCSAACPIVHWKTLVALIGSIFLAISGSTIFNMIFDRDIDAKMGRTAKRPLPSGLLKVEEAFFCGAVLAVTGITWAFLLNPLYGFIVAGGLLINVVGYTIIFKRRTAFSILFGGVAGGMPILAGRTLGLGSIDLIGGLLALAVLLWIPTHIMTFSIKYAEDYKLAGIPTFPSGYGVEITRKLVALSTVLASFSMITAAHLIGMKGHYLMALALFSLALIIASTLYLKKPCLKFDMRLYKAASVYMLVSMLLIGFGI